MTNENIKGTITFVDKKGIDNQKKEIPEVIVKMVGWLDLN